MNNSKCSLVSCLPKSKFSILHLCNLMSLHLVCWFDATRHPKTSSLAPEMATCFTPQKNDQTCERGKKMNSKPTEERCLFGWCRLRRRWLNLWLRREWGRWRRGPDCSRRNSQRWGKLHLAPYLQREGGGNISGVTDFLCVFKEIVLSLSKA